MYKCTYTCTYIDRFWKLIYDLHKCKSLYIHLSSFQCERKTRYDQPIATYVYDPACLDLYAL